MAKISPVAAKYIIHSTINIEGVVDRPDVIGAIFGQTEGLLGSDLELRELQRSGRIGRIEVNVSTSSGKTHGEIIIPSSLDKTETAIVGAALEIIQRIGPCNAKVLVEKIEDVRISKRQFVIERAKELLRELTDKTLPDSQELADEVSQSVRVMEITEYGREKLAAGPAIDESEEIVIVEGRADVLNLLRQGFKNAIAMNGTSCPETIKELARKKNATLFVDGDRGGNLIIRELLSVTEIDFVCKAPDGKEVEEITKKEIHKALRGRITAEQAKLELGIDDTGALKNDQDPKLTQRINPSIPRKAESNLGNFDRRPEQKFQKHMPIVATSSTAAPARPMAQAVPSAPRRTVILTSEEKAKFKETLDDLFGTRGACLLDANLTIMGKVPLSELASTIKSLNGGIYALVLDGAVDLDLVRIAEKLGITHLVGTSNKFREASRVNILTDEKLV